MKNIYTTIIALLISASCYGQAWISQEQLAKDYDLLTTALKELHGGLYRYDSKSVIEEGFANYKTQFTSSQSLQEAYIVLSEMLATVVRDGHTYPNYWNQTGDIQNTLFNGADKIPFTLKYIEGEWLLENDLSGNGLSKGSKILSIQGIPVKTIQDQLMKKFKVDGRNMIKKYNQLNLTGQDKFEPVDIYLPLLITPNEGEYQIIMEDVKGEQSELSVELITREERKQRLESEYGVTPKSHDDMWEKRDLNNNTAYIKQGTYVTWRMDMDWKDYIEQFFIEANNSGKESIIIDIRGNSGGMGEVFWYTLKFLVDEKMEVETFKQRFAYQKVGDDIKPYLESWEKGLFDLSERTVSAENGTYRRKGMDKATRLIRPNDHVFKGNVYLLTDGSNSSATFMMAKALKSKNLATTVGESTGGNLMGTTGGQMFMLRLPNSGLEVDVPLIGYYPATNASDSGLLPDYAVEQSSKDFIEGVDSVLEYTLRLIKSDKTN